LRKKDGGRNARAPVRTFNPRYAEAEGALPGQFRHLHTDI
jgi:type I restriction enzyme R subunit